MTGGFRVTARDDDLERFLPERMRGERVRRLVEPDHVRDDRADSAGVRGQHVERRDLVAMADA